MTEIFVDPNYFYKYLLKMTFVCVFINNNTVKKKNSTEFETLTHSFANFFGFLCISQ